MQIECPECHQIHSLTPEEFQESDGTTTCPNCSAQFDPLANLSETIPNRELFPWEKTSKPIANSFWVLGVIAGLILLGIQFFYFKSDDLAQNKTIRPLLIQVCDLLDCQLPLYRNTKEFSVLHSAFILKKDHYTLNAAIRNEAPFSQPFPDIKLTLLNYNGSLVAQRIFDSENYLPNNKLNSILNSQETFIIELNIALPDEKVGGFNIGLL